MSLTQYQYNEIEREYNRIQIKNQRELDSRIENIYKKIPRIKTIQSLISSLSVSEAKKRLFSGPSDGGDYHLQIQALIKEKETLLKEHGYPADYLTMQYDCSLCRDTGYLEDNSKCTCRKQAEIKLLYSQSNIETILSIENFEHFNFQYFDSVTVDPLLGKTPLQNMQEIYQIAKNFIRDFSTTFSNLYIYGNTGVGKTYLANCIAKELMDASYSVIYLSAIDLFHLLADKDFNRRQSIPHNYIARHLTDCDLLIIDDLGTELPNSFTVSALFECLNQRLMKRRPVIISTNLSLQELQAHYSERILSRIVDNYKMLKIIGRDIRIHKPTNSSS